MRALAGDRPKALLEVAGHSLLAHAAAEAREAGLERIVVVANPTAHDALEREAWRCAARSVVVDQVAPRGLADAIRIGALALSGEPFAVLLRTTCSPRRARSRGWSRSRPAAASTRCWWHG